MFTKSLPVSLLSDELVIQDASWYPMTEGWKGAWVEIELGMPWCLWLPEFSEVVMGEF